MTDSHAIPLTIYAPSTDGFRVRTPPSWTADLTIMTLFDDYQMADHGWRKSKTEIEDLGVTQGWRFWRISKK